MLPRVIHVASGREWRGGERQVLLLAVGLAREGIPQLAITSLDGRLFAELHAAGIPCRAVRWPSAFSPGAVLAAVRAARASPSLLHAHDPHALVAAGVAATLTRTPLVATRRVTFPLRRPGFWVRSNRVIAISHAVRDALIASGVPASSIALVPSAIDLETTRTIGPAALHTSFAIPANAPVAISVAAMTPEKDHLTLIEAARALQQRCPDLRWVLLGDGPGRAALEARIAETGIGSLIHFGGWVDDPRPFIAASSVFVSTSTDEGLGTAMLDAMALGVPVVATRVGGTPDLLEGGAGILTPPGTPQATADAVAMILDDAVRRGWTLERAREAVARFALPGMVEGVRGVYRSAVLAR